MDEMKNNTPEETEEESVSESVSEESADETVPEQSDDKPESAEPKMPEQSQGAYYHSSYGYSTQSAYQPPVQRSGDFYANYPDTRFETNNNNPEISEEESKKRIESNRKGRVAFLVVIAIVALSAVVVIPFALSGKLNFTQFFYETESLSETTTVDESALLDEEFSHNGAALPDGDVPQFDISDTPVTNDSGTATGVLTAEQVYEKIAESNVAVMVYMRNELYTEGTGIVMQESGEYTYILTCAHVISDSGVDIVIQMENGVRYDAEMVGYDLRTDIGVLKIKATGLKVAEFGNSDSLKVGSNVYAIGNPGGSALFGTFTDGKVSAIGRNITSSIGYDMVCIQHNAAISPGNSGGALVNAYGQVIGINSAKIAATDFEGISFAIPITQAKDVINELIEHGFVTGRPKLGITYVENDSSQIDRIYAMYVQREGLPSGSLVIYSIDEASDLVRTDVKPGDMITAVNGKKLDTADVLLETIENSQVGDELELKIFRINNDYSVKEFTVKVKLIEESNINPRN